MLCAVKLQVPVQASALRGGGVVRGRQVEHLDGRRVPLEARVVTRPGQVVLLKGEGMPLHDSVRSSPP